MVKCHKEQLTAVLATSASRHDAESSKPAPDIVQAALDASDLAASDCVFVRDARWDLEAAEKVGTSCDPALRGDIAEAALRAAGAIAIYPCVRALLQAFERTPLR